MTCFVLTPNVSVIPRKQIVNRLSNEVVGPIMHIEPLQIFHPRDEITKIRLPNRFAPDTQLRQWWQGSGAQAQNLRPRPGVRVVNTIGEMEIEALKGGKVKPVKEIPDHARARVGDYSELGQEIREKEIVWMKWDEWNGVIIPCRHFESLEKGALGKGVPNIGNCPCHGYDF